MNHRCLISVCHHPKSRHSLRILYGDIKPICLDCEKVSGGEWRRGNAVHEFVKGGRD